MSKTGVVIDAVKMGIWVDPDQIEFNFEGFPSYECMMAEYENETECPACGSRWLELSERRLPAPPFVFVEHFPVLECARCGKFTIPPDVLDWLDRTTETMRLNTGSIIDVMDLF